MAHFQNRWGEITEDSWVLSVVRKRYKIPFVNKSFLSPTPILLQQTKSLALEEEVNKHLLKRAMEKREPEGPGFYSHIFLVPKKNGKFRLIIDMFRLNTFLDIQSFRIRNQVHQEILRDRQFTIELIMSLGLIINEEKSDLVLSQNFVFIGMEFLTHKNIVPVPLDRVQGILELLLWFKKQKQVSARVFLSLLGKLSAAAQFVVLGRLHLHPLQMALFAQWKPHVLPLEYPILLNAPIRKHLEWWDNKGRFISGVTLKPSLSSHSLFMDASLSGWGAHLKPEGLLFHGVWTLD